MTLIVKLNQRFLSNRDYTNNFWRKREVICIWLSRYSTARGPDPWYNRDGPAKVGARKSFKFTESSLVVEKKSYQTRRPFRHLFHPQF